MTTFLFIIICIIFIGLGLPDSLFGAAWPAIYPDFNLPISYANFVTMLISLGTVIASFFSAKLINKFGTALVTAVSTAMTAVALIGFALSNSIWWFCLLALPLGAGAGAIDAALNNYVAVHYGSMQMSFLHCFYGVGVALSPFIMSLALGVDNDWRLGYRIIFYLQIAITAISFLSFPLWKKAGNLKEQKEKEVTPVTLSFKTMLKIPAVRAAWVLMFSSVALEFICGIWGCTFLVGAEGLSEADAARTQTFYYIGITAGRFVSGLLSNVIHPKKIIYLGYSVVALAILMLFLPFPPAVKGLALFLVGLGNGPTFPNITYLTPINFGTDISQSIVGTQMAFCNLGILIMPPIFGIFADKISVGLFPVFLLAMFLVMAISTIVYNKLPKPKSTDLNLK